MSAPPLPQPCFVIGVTGHRASHASFPQDTSELDQVLAQIFDRIDAALVEVTSPDGEPCACSVTLVTLLADGTDHCAAELALAREWQLVTPLPFGRRLNTAINAGPQSPADARAILDGKPVADEATAGRVAAIESLAAKARVFELADQDAAVKESFLAAIGQPQDIKAVTTFEHVSSRRAALAGTVLIEQSDLIVAVWDGQSTDPVGGTGHTVAEALAKGSPVLWINPENPPHWRILRAPESLHGRHGDEKADQSLEHVVASAVSLQAPEAKGRFAGIATIGAQCWRDQSGLASHAFRRIESVFGERRFSARFASLRQQYELPSQIGAGSHKGLVDAITALPAGDKALPGKVESEVLRRFAWTDAISASLSDRYRSGMVINFLLGAAAIIVGTLYLPLVDVTQKWIFAALELLLLLAIVANTANGLRARLHGRWFETRRAAEYLRHSPMMVALGIARPTGVWPQGVKSWWPEWYVRHSLRGIGLPEAQVDRAYLRAILAMMRDLHVDPQRSYHRGKAERLNRVHHGLDHLSELSFAAAIGVVSLYLALAALAHFGQIDAVWLGKAAKWFTVAAVALPTIGGAIAAIRYYGDFERFAEISEVTAEKLDHVAERVGLLLDAPHDSLDFGAVARIMHDTDEIVFSEIQNWQAVFSGKRTTIPA
ncbi:hypothetical protein [Parerythrobacter jejuensis]|uniref:SMODS and SLOG-associating 2TM effector domain-containing protein n=1 Tax=Parerythrobacter jejuensis TaxID=795812 RepID=A0A845ARF7_9SPHN|nr:hypothetical protein [Parerythrobacter jejuensis]MXP31421.1 hypothetical protein [Parerythrobacter jejuensis]